jgi:hypothetical protein
MDTFRRVALVLITPLFIFLLAIIALDFGVLHIAGQPQGVKKILNDSDVYSSLIPDALAQSGQISSSKTEIPLNQQVIQDAAKQAFTPQVLKQSSESAVDGIYHWLNGKSSQPDFRIELTQAKVSFADAVANAAGKQAASLPRCPSSGLPADFDPFSATCLPRSVTIAEVTNQARNAVLTGKGFLEHPIITADSIKNNHGQSPFATNLKDLPSKFQKIKSTPIIFSLLALLSAVAIVFLSKSHRKAVKHLGFILVTVGILMLIFAYALGWAVSNKLPASNLKVGNAVLEKDVKKVAVKLGQTIDKNYWWFGGIYTVLGAAAIAEAIYYRRGPATEPIAAEAAPVDKLPKTPVKTKAKPPK